MWDGVRRQVKQKYDAAALEKQAILKEKEAKAAEVRRGLFVSLCLHSMSLCLVIRAIMDVCGCDTCPSTDASHMAVYLVLSSCAGSRNVCTIQAGAGIQSGGEQPHGQAHSTVGTAAWGCSRVDCQ